MNINELPEEILVRILSFLSQSDRLESALTCRRWAQTVARAPPLLRDIWLEIGVFRTEEASSVFANSQRQYENLRLYAVLSLEFNAAFWKSVGPGLRKLKLIRCCRAPEEFYSILQACSNLESLEICEDTEKRLKLSELPPSMIVERIQRSMRNLRHLHLDLPLNADALENLFILMPNVSSIDLWSCDGLSELVRHLPKMLGANRSITALKPHWRCSKDDAGQLLRIASAGLRTLDYAYYNVLHELRSCSMLRDLELFVYSEDVLRFSQDIIQNLPELESLLIIMEGKPSTREDFAAIFDLKKLRKLYLDLNLVTGEHHHVPDQVVSDLSRMVSLESLTVGKQLGIIDSTRFRILASMPNLRDLTFHRLQWDADCVRIVIFDLGKLRRLEIRDHLCDSHIRASPDQYSELEHNIPIAKNRQGEQKFSSLEDLTMDSIPLTDVSLVQITAHHSRLKIVHFYECNYITDVGFATLFQHEPLLEKLTIYHVPPLDGTFLGGLGELCRRLRLLQVWNGYLFRVIGSRAQEELKSRRPRVKWDLD